MHLREVAIIIQVRYTDEEEDNERLGERDNEDMKRIIILIVVEKRNKIRFTCKKLADVDIQRIFRLLWKERRHVVVIK